MKSFNLDQLEETAEGLALGFYMLMFMALVTLLAGSAGSGFELLLAGSLAQVGRAGIEEFVAVRRAEPPAARGLSAQRLR
jgi:hypothetical protein